MNAANAEIYAEPEPLTVEGSPDLNVKPKIRPTDGGATMLVTLPCGATGTIRLRGDNHGSGWHYTVDGLFDHRGPAEYVEIRNALEALAHEKSRLRLERLAASETMLRGLAIEADTIDGACKILRKLLRERTGRDWSVSRGRGTAYCWLKIHAPPKRRAEHGYLSIEDQILLSAALGHWVHCQGESIRPGGDVRGAYVFRAAGVPVPDDWKIAEPGWD